MQNPFETIETRLGKIESLLLDFKNTKQPEAERWFDLNELCNYLPDKPAKPTVYTWVQNNLIPYHKGAKKLRFLKSEIDEWLKTGKQKTVTELVEQVENNLVKKKGGKRD